MRTYREENSNSMFSTEILQTKNPQKTAFDYIHNTESKAESDGLGVGCNFAPWCRSCSGSTKK